MSPRVHPVQHQLCTGAVVPSFWPSATGKREWVMTNRIWRMWMGDLPRCPVLGIRGRAACEAHRGSMFPVPLTYALSST